MVAATNGADASVNRDVITTILGVIPTLPRVHLRPIPHLTAIPTRQAARQTPLPVLRVALTLARAVIPSRSRLPPSLPIRALLTVRRIRAVPVRPGSCPARPDLRAPPILSRRASPILVPARIGVIRRVVPIDLPT